METTPTIAPKVRRRLGLSGSLGRHLLTPVSTPKTPLTNISENINTEVTSITTKSDVNNASSGYSKTSAAKTPKEDPGNSKNLLINSNETPVTSKQKNTNYKLSLSKVTTETVTRRRMLSLNSASLIQPKRLKLEDENIEPKDESISNQHKNCDTKLPDDCDKTSEETLRAEIDELKETIATIEKYEQRVPELLRLIKKWQDAGRKTIDELKELIQPQQDIEVILAHFQIDPGLFYVELPE